MISLLIGFVHILSIMLNRDFAITHASIIVAICVCAIWGETFVSSKILLEKGLMPAEIFFFRFILAYICILFFSHKRMWANSWRHELLFVGLGLSGGSLYFLSENMALMYSTASNVAILVGSTPLVTALLVSAFYRDERMNGRQVVGSIIAFIGMTLVILNGQLILHLNPKGDILAVIASIVWGFYSLIMKQLSSKYDTLFITRKVFAYGLIGIIPYFLAFESPSFTPEILGLPAVWGNIVYLGVVASMLCYFAWNWALKRLGTVRATNVIYMQPFFTMLISFFILNERITWMAITGSVILIIGMTLAVRNKKG